MSEPFLGEICIVAFNFAPPGWALCDGQILPINQNQSLYSLLGTTYGGDGRTSFALPDLRGRTPIHVGASNGTNHPQGQKSGEETHTLSAGEMPSHDHVMNASTDTATGTDASGNVLATVTSNVYNNVTPFATVDMLSAASLPTGGGQAHDNMQPWLALNFCIALQGLFPSRN